MNKFKAAFAAAFPMTLPIATAIFFTGISYGAFITSKGFSPWYPFFTSLFVYAGTMEFVLVSLLLAPFAPLNALLITLTVNARHLFYGISMLKKLQGLGLKKLYLIYTLSDETFAINSSATLPTAIDRTAFMLCVTALNQSYWICGVNLGALIGSNINFNSKGLDFAMAALFIAIFVRQWQKPTGHRAALLGILSPLPFLVLFGPQYFLPPAMLALAAVFIATYYYGGDRL